MNVRTILACAVSAAIGAGLVATVTQAGDSSPTHYTVEAADTWQSIAQAHGVSADALQLANNLAASTSNSSHPRTGWVIHIPEAPAPTTTTSTTVAPTTTQPPTTTAAPATTTTQAPTTTAAATTTSSIASSTTSTMPPMHMACPGIPDTTPIGAVSPALPMLCDTLSSGVPSTFSNGANSWLDDFEHNASMTDIGTGYKRFEVSSLEAGSRSATFRHNNHWMVDVWAPNQGVGGSTMRPDRSFKFENGKLVVETDVAGGIEDYDGFAWPEVTVSLSSAPDGYNYGPTPAKSIGDDLYAYGRFGGYDTIGIRLTGAQPIEAYYDASQQGFKCGRVWEISWFQDGSDSCNANRQTATIQNFPWNHVRSCQGVDPDTNCRDRFRWELTQDKITVYANGVKLLEHTAQAGKHLVPDSILNGELYVYFSDSVYQPPAGRVVRFHWDRVAVNPATGPSPSPTCVPAHPC